jgi:hypothetical protein
LLIDRTHRPWIAVTAALAAAAVGLYVYLARATPGGLTGGDLVGMWYGLAGSALMLFAGSLSLLRRVPSWWWLGPRKSWLRGHVWLGLLGGVLILCHSGGRLGGPLEQLLMAVVLLTLLTGVAGLALQQFLPRLVTLRVAGEAPYEQIPHLCAAMREAGDELLARAEADPSVDREGLGLLKKFYLERVRPFLAGEYHRASPLAHPLQAEALFDEVGALAGGRAPREALARLRTFCEERRQLGEQERLHFWLHSWLLLHVPLSVMLLVLGAAHAVASLYY